MSNARPSLTWRAYRTPKAGNSLAEYEDAFAADPERGRFAIADGASESAFAGAWARILADAFVQAPQPSGNWLPAARRTWRAEHQELNLPWWAENKLAEGAFAALLGVTFGDEEWHAEAIGDCCLFQIRNDRLKRGFPIRRPAEFANRPNLLGSQRREATEVRTKRMHLAADWKTGDRILLMSDALAEWFLLQFERRCRPWEQVQAIAAQDEFANWISKLRESSGLRNDDVTLALIESTKECEIRSH